MVHVLGTVRMLRLGREMRKEMVVSTTGMAMFVWWPKRSLFRHHEEKVRLS
jgi:hypothetical protein